MLTKQRKAIAMIELIFAIVVMGIVMLSAPMLINRATQSSYVALQQESIAALATQINTIMATSWDANDTNYTVVGEPVLRTVSTTLNQCTGPSRFPVGVTSVSGRYCIKDSNSTAYYNASSVLGLEGTEIDYYDDIDDFENNISTVDIYNFESIATYEGDYIDTNISMLSRLYYADDVPKKVDGSPSTGGYDTSIQFANPFKDTNASSTNIKLISVSLTSVNQAAELNQKQIRLSAFMCNIGAPKEIISNETQERP